MAEEKIIEAKVQPKEYIVHARIVGWKPLGILDNHNYEKLFNKPKINGVELIGDKSLDELGVGDEIDDKINHHNNDQHAHEILYVNTKELTALLENDTAPERNKLIETSHGIPAIKAWIIRLLTNLENRFTGTKSSDTEEISLWGIRNRADEYNKNVVGTEKDSIDNLTIWGVRNRSDKHTSDITGTANDPDTALTLNGLSKKDASNYNTLDKKIDTTKDDLIGSTSDAPGKTTINGALNKAAQVQNIILGAKSDPASKLTLYGLSKKIDDAQNAVTGESTDTEDDLTLWGLKKRIMIHGTDANKSIEDLTKMIDTNSKSITDIMGTDPDSTDDESIYGLRNNLHKLRKDTFGNQDDSSDVLTMNGINNRLNALANVINGGDEEATKNLKSLSELSKEVADMQANVANNLTTTEDGYVLDARMGKELADRVASNTETISNNGKSIASNTESINSIKQDVADIKSKGAAAGKTKLTLIAANWTGNAAPYVYELGSDYTNKLVNVSFDGDNGTVDQLSWLVGANVQGGELTKLYAFGRKPTVDIPVILSWIGGLNG